MNSALLQGWWLMAGLIPAIGAQNALVLRQGLLRQHLGPVVLLCAASDCALVAAGVFGVGASLAQSPQWLEAMRWGGAAFLVAYSLRAALRAWRGSEAALQPAARGGRLAATLGTTLALTFLNPHVYLDTLLLVGVVGAQHGAEDRASFALGASVASVMWFVALGYGATALAPWLRRPGIWRSIDATVAAIMGWVALQLLSPPA